VLFIMISNHYGMTYNHPYNWLVLAAIMAAGVLIRHFFNLKHKGRIVIGYPAAGVAILLVVAIAIAPKPAAKSEAVAGVDNAVRVQTIVQQRCVACHSATPSFQGFATAPAGVMLDTPEMLRQHAERVYKQVVQLKAMPLGNLTKMTDDERAAVAAWYESGAK
jgi:uncharacterized membrane protein